MPTFTYQARDEAGRLVRGTVEAESRVALADRLRKMGYLVIRMGEAGKGLWPAGARVGFGPSEETVLFSVVQLANLLEAGVPLATSLKTVADQSPHPALQRAWSDAVRQVEAGMAFSQALERPAQVFPPLLAQLVAVGEATGKLDAVLNRFAGFLEKDLSLRRGIQSALTYPALVALASMGLILFVVTFVVPKFAALFHRAGMSLPAPTRLLAGVGGLIRQQGWFLAMLAGVAMVALGWLLRNPAVRRYRDACLLRLPLVGPIVRQAVLARFCRTLATLIASGTPILRALETARRVVGNDAVAQEVDRVRVSVERGERMADALALGTVFYPDAIQMIRSGEESGRLDVLLDKVADFYDLRVEHALKQVTVLLEPLLLFATGGVVAFIMASLLLPMFDMVKLLQTGGLR